MRESPRREDVVQLQRFPIDREILEIICVAVGACGPQRRQPLATVGVFRMADDQTTAFFGPAEFSSRIGCAETAAESVSARNAQNASSVFMANRCMKGSINDAPSPAFTFRRNVRQGNATNSRPETPSETFRPTVPCNESGCRVTLLADPPISTLAPAPTPSVASPLAPT